MSSDEPERKSEPEPEPESQTETETETGTERRREEERESARARERRRVAEIFGDVLPESTTDDRDEGQDGRGGVDGRGTDARDAELLRDVPPHHG